MDNNKHKHKDNKINDKKTIRVNYKEKINSATKGIEMKKSASTSTKEVSNGDKEKNAGTEIVKGKGFRLSNCCSK